MKRWFCSDCEKTTKFVYDAKEKYSYCSKCGVIMDEPKKRPQSKPFKLIMTCPKCRSRKIAFDMDKFHTICKKCGFIIKKEKKWPKKMIEKFWKDLEYHRRVEALEKETKYCPECFSKKIAVNWSDEYLYCEKCGLIVKRFKEKKLYKLTKLYKILPNVLRPPKQRALDRVYFEMQRVAGILNMDGAKGYYEVKHIWKKLYDNKFTYRRSRPEIIGALFDIVARRDGRPVLPNDIIRATDCNARTMDRFSKLICRTLNIKLPPRDPELFIPRFISKLKLDNKIELATRNVIKQARNKNLIGGRSHRAVVGTAIKLACDLCSKEMPYKEVCRTVDVSERVLREFTPFLKDEIDIK